MKLTKIENANRFLDAFMFSLESEEGVLVSHVKTLQKYTKSRDRRIATRATILLSQWLDEAADKPIRGLKLVANLVLEKELLQQWLSDLKKAERAAKSSKKEEKGHVLHAEFPDISKWKNVTEYPEAAIQVGRILASFGKYQAAISVYDRIGRKIEGVPRILSAEGGGDLMMVVRRWPQAIEWFSYALNVGDFIRKSASYESNPDKILIFILDRIKRKLKEADRHARIEALGKGQVLYAEARTFQLVKKDYLRGAVAFQKIIDEVPNTCYSEGAVLYKAECYFQLSKPDEKKKAKTAISVEEKTRILLKQRLKRYAKAITRKVRADWVKRIDELTVAVISLKAIPLGNEASQTGQKSLLKFITGDEKKYKLYRGEGYIVLAEFYMERLLDPEKAEEILVRGEKWFEEVEKMDEALDGFQVPTKAAVVSAPPQVLTKIDNFDNLDRIEIKPNFVINRLTCPFYLDDLRARLYSMKGFLRFARGDSEGAKECYAFMKKFDAVNKAHENRGDWGDYRRLMWGLEHGYFYARPQELKLYEGRKRYSVLLADYYYITMQFSRAADTYHRILRGEAGKVSRNQEDYLHYAYGAALYQMDRRVDSIAQMKKVFANKRNSFTTERAMFAAGKASTGVLGGGLPAEERKVYRKEGTELLERLAKKGRHAEFVYRARIMLAVNCHRNGEKKRCTILLKDIPKSAGKYKKLADFYLDIFQEGG